VLFFLVNQLKGSFLGAGRVFIKLCLHRKPLELTFLISSANVVGFGYGDLLKAAAQINNEVQN